MSKSRSTSILFYSISIAEKVGLFNPFSRFFFDFLVFFFRFSSFIIVFRDTEKKFRNLRIFPHLVADTNFYIWRGLN